MSAPSPTPASPADAPRPPRLLDRLRRVLRVRHYSPCTEQCHVEWVSRFIRLHGLRHPASMGTPEIEQFLTDLAVNGPSARRAENRDHDYPLFARGSSRGGVRATPQGPRRRS